MTTYSPWLRISGTHAPAQQVLVDSAAWLSIRGVMALQSSSFTGDYAQIDPELETEPTDLKSEEEFPRPGIGYAGLNEEQRYLFLNWTERVRESAPPSFRHLYVSSLEVNLIESSLKGGRRWQQLREHIGSLLAAKAWLRDPYLTQLHLLDRVLNPEAPEVADVYSMEVLTPSLAGTALGMQALREEALTPAQVRWLSTIWRIDAAHLDPTLTALRLDETRQRGGDLLADALAALPDAARQPKVWRTAHRDLRLALPQPDLRSLLEPRLRELFASTPGLVATLEEDEEGEAAQQGEESQPNTVALPELSPELTFESDASERVDLPKKGKGKRAASAKASEGAKEWQLIVEFSEGRSQYTSFALEVAQKLPGYTTLLDENRTIVHRVYMRKSELRRFWRLWDYIQGWSNTHVYLNGKELEKWQIWPWSHYLR